MEQGDLYTVMTKYNPYLWNKKPSKKDKGKKPALDDDMKPEEDIWMPEEDDRESKKYFPNHTAIGIVA